MLLAKWKLLLCGLLPILHLKSIEPHWLQSKCLSGLLLDISGLIFYAVVADSLRHGSDPWPYCTFVLGQLREAQTWLFMLEIHCHEVLLRLTSLVRNLHWNGGVRVSGLLSRDKGRGVLLLRAARPTCFQARGWRLPWVWEVLGCRLRFTLVF